MEFITGQKVRITNERPSGHVAGGWNDEMDKYLGKVVTLARKSGYHRNAFNIEEDNKMWIWDSKLFVPVKEKKAVVIKTLDEMEKHFKTDILKVIPVGAILEKIIHDGDKCLVCFVSYKDYIIKTVTKCHEEDEFSFQKGMEIAMYNTAKRIAERELKTLCK